MKKTNPFIKFITHPALAISLFVIGITLIILKENLNSYNANGIITAYFEAPTCLAVSNDGKYALVDNDFILYVLEEVGEEEFSTVYMIRPKNTENIGEVTFDEAGNLYAVISDAENETIRISAYDIDGNYMRDVFFEENVKYYMDYVNNVCALNYKDGYLYFIQTHDSGVAEIVKCGTTTSYLAWDTLNAEENGAVVIDSIYNNNSYALVNSDHSAGLMNEDGSYKEFLLSDFDYYDNEDGSIISFAVPYENGIAFIDANEPDKIYYMDAETGEVYELIDAADLYPYEKIWEDEKNYISELYAKDDSFMFTIFDCMYVSNENGITEISYADNLPFPVICVNLIMNYGWVIGLILGSIGFILCIGDLMKWRMTILWKQIFTTVPIVIIMFVIIILSFINEITAIYKESVADELMEFNEIVLNGFDAEDIKTMTNFSIAVDGRADNLENMLVNLLNFNQSDWSKDLVCSLYITNNSMDGLMLATTEYKRSAFVNSMELETSWQEEHDYAMDHPDFAIKVNDYTVVITVSSYTNEYITAVTPIFDSEGYQVAMLTTELDTGIFYDKLEEIIVGIIQKAAIFLAVLIAVIVLNSYFSVRRLKEAGSTITEIASGNFDVRINHIGKDEVGDICEGVNEMAKQLECHFEEMERNEQFYYKFVPEKFRELLHKEAFTDLRLGDAESAELTVLFCDIRSFSLNSEMMTAKENFEFVNVIYGKAGPIIREHNGFVDKYIGDAVMALFESADDAVAAGIELYKQIVLNPETAKELKVEEINIGIGIHSGMARIGIVGEDERLSGTVISNTVNISSRLESLTKQYKTAMLITKETLDRLSDPDSLNTRYLGMIQVAGVNEVKALYEVLDCLEDERRIPRERSAHDFREAIKQFHMGDPDSAVKLLKQIDTNKVADPVPEKYLSYIEEKIYSGDKEHNVFKFSRK